MPRLSDIVHIGDIVATSNIEGYEGAELGVYLGVERTRGEGLLYINWLNNPRAIEKVFTSDFNRYFYPVKLVGIDRKNKLIYKRIKRRFTHTNAEISAITGKPIVKNLKKII